MEVRRMRYLCVEIYKTLNDLNPDIFQVEQSSYSTRRPYNMKVPRVNQTTFGTGSILYEGTKIWNHLPNKTNDLILNLTPENVTQHSRIVTTTHKGSSTPTKMSKIIGNNLLT